MTHISKAQWHSSEVWGLWLSDKVEDRVLQTQESSQNFWKLTSMKECVRSDKINYRQFNIFQLNIKNLFSFDTAGVSTAGCKKLTGSIVHTHGGYCGKDTLIRKKNRKMNFCCISQFIKIVSGLDFKFLSITLFHFGSFPEKYVPFSSSLLQTEYF